MDHIDTGGSSTDIDPDALGMLRDDVAAGRLVEDGTEVVEGRELIRLAGIEGTATAGHVVLVDPDTYLPVRARGTLDGRTYRQTYEYLPRTPDTLALLVPPIPEGFIRVDPLTGESNIGPCDGRPLVSGLD